MCAGRVLRADALDYDEAGETGASWTPIIFAPSGNKAFGERAPVLLGRDDRDSASVSDI